MGILDKISKKGGKGKAEKAPVKKDVKKEAKPAKKAAEPSKTPSRAAGKAEEQKEVKGIGKKESRPEASFAYSIISRPVSTEKSDRQQMHGKYTFYVARGANKIEIARAIRTLYGVSPVSVSVMNAKGKQVRFGRHQGRRKATRKAIVTLKEGDSISLAE